MDDEQLDLFAGSPGPTRGDARRGDSPPEDAEAPPTTSFAQPGRLEDAALVAALPLAGMVETVALAEEAGRRRLAAAVPALEAVIRRLAGFGARGPAVREQAAALSALAAIGGAAAARAVSQAIVRQEVQGATLAAALSAAARVGASLPAELMPDWLGHEDPEVRASACRLARPQPAVQGLLIERLADLDPAVRLAAACALGRMGRGEARPMLIRRLETAPSSQILEALAGVADEDAVVRMGRLGRARPKLAGAVLKALEACDHPRATTIAEGLRRFRQPPG
jgi:hypothetical protein